LRIQETTNHEEMLWENTLPYFVASWWIDLLEAKR